MKRIIIYTILFVTMATHAMAQTSDLKLEEKKPPKAWEFGVGGSVFQFNRTSFSNFTENEAGYTFDLKMDKTVFGGNIYVARELNKHFYLDLQGTVGATKNKLNDDNKTEWLYMVGPGLQWRFGEYFDSKHIDPYVRVGANYMYKKFNIQYEGTEGIDSDQMKWYLQNLQNKSGADKKNLFPISLGVGLNMWLNDKWGIGLQGDYLLMPYKNVANSLQGTLRVMYRIGGGSKKTQPVVEYIDRVVEVQKIVEKIVPTESTSIKIKEIDKLFFLDNIHFEFDKAVLMAESNEILDNLSRILQQDTSQKYLITGYTDARGKEEYNMELSKKRAEVVARALTDRGVPATMLKARGVGSKISYAKVTESDEVRKGDRKMTIELISNMDYWDYLLNNSF